MNESSYDVRVNLLHLFSSLVIALVAAFFVTRVMHVPPGFAARLGFALVWAGAYLLLHRVRTAGAIATSAGALAWTAAPLAAKAGALHA